MSFFKKTKADIALSYFHKPPAYYNCAQAIYKAFQEDYSISNDEISDLSKHGNGKAKEGQCGAYFVGMELLKKSPNLAAEFQKRFQEKSDYISCFDIRFNDTMSCRNLVRFTAELLAELTILRTKKDG